jgi:hypothetical protein
MFYNLDIMGLCDPAHGELAQKKRVLVHKKPFVLLYVKALLATPLHTARGPGLLLFLVWPYLMLSSGAIIPMTTAEMVIIATTCMVKRCFFEM